VKSIRRIKVNLQETIKPNISNKSKNILAVSNNSYKEETLKYLCLTTL